MTMAQELPRHQIACPMEARRVQEESGSNEAWNRSLSINQGADFSSVRKTMEKLLPFVIFGGIAVLILGGIAYSMYAVKKRREDMLEAAESMGLTFFPDGDAVLLNRLSKFKLFNQGRGRKMRNLIQGDSGEVKIAIFDYQYTTGSGKNSHTHHQSVVALQSSDLVCPDFSMRPEGMFDKIGSALGFQDIDFETHPTFSKSFVLQSSNEKAIRAYFTPALLEFFESKPGISVEAQSGTLFFYRTRRRVKPHEIRDHLAQAYEVFGVMTDQA
jgi:hypothetical protein